MTTDQIAFRNDVRDWLAANLTEAHREVERKAVSVFVAKEHNLAWQAVLNSKGWVAPHWPVEYGGTGWNEVECFIFASECARAGAPSLSPMGLRMVAPCIMKFGSAAQKAYYLPRLLSGEDYWCQGYSEPQSGSDLASLSLRAERDGDDYVLTGSKIWTTHAHFANRMFCLVRTSREGRPQAGISFLLLDMDTPGITVRPILSLSGDHDFNQVFFDAACVPIANRLGEENQGWAVAKYLLEFERASAYAAGLASALDEVRAAANTTPAGDGGVMADRPDIARTLAQMSVDIAAIEASEQGVMMVMAQGRNPGPLSSMLKVQGTETQQRIQQLALEIAGPYGAVEQYAARQVGSNVEPIGPQTALVAAARYFNGRAASIYGGSNEIQRGIMAKQVLGL